jgi:Winged helix DNA-binding domain
MVHTIGWQQALGWRMRRQLLDPIGLLSVTGVVDRLCGVQTQVASSAELAIRVRRTASRPGEVNEALSEGRLIKTWAMRGALHLLTPESARAVLSLMATGRSWERPSWQRYFGMPVAQWDVLRDAVHVALGDRSLSREELIAAVVAQPGLGHLEGPLRSGWGTLLKPLAWQGELCFGPNRGNRVTFVRTEVASPRWLGLLDPHEAAPVVIAAYFGAFGPATIDAFGTWLAGGWFGKIRLRTWIDALGDRLARIDVEGEPAYVLAQHLDELLATKPSATVRLLPGFDQYVMGPGTSDGHIVPAARRAAVSRQSGWISPVLVFGGVVSGTWDVDGDRLRIGWFRETGRPPASAIAAEVGRLSAILDRALRVTIDLV